MKAPKKWLEVMHSWCCGCDELDRHTYDEAALECALDDIFALSQVGAGGVVDERGLDEARKVYNASLLSDGGAFGATERIVKAYLAALAASPSAGENPGLAGARAEAARQCASTISVRIPPAPVQTASVEAVDREFTALRVAYKRGVAWRAENPDANSALVEKAAYDYADKATASLTAPTQGDDERAAMEAVMENVDPSVWPGLTAAQRCALGRFAKPFAFLTAPTQGAVHGPDEDGLYYTINVAGMREACEPPVQTASVEAVDLHDFITHRRAWRKALEMALAASDSEQVDGYWEHEIKAFDRAFDLIAPLASLTAPTQGDGGEAAALEAEIERLRSANMQKHMEWQKTAAERAIFKRERDEAQSALAALAAPSSPVSSPSPDDLAVDRFAAAMKDKLAKKRAEGRGGWEDKDDCSNAFLSQLLREHVGKGDPVDVGNLAMMIHQRGERIATPLSPVSSPSPAGGVREALEWYAEHVAGCRKLGSIGDPFRHALDRDGGKRATNALAALSSPATGEVMEADFDNLIRLAVDAVSNLDDWTNVNETEFTGWGDGEVPPGAVFWRIKSGQALKALRDLASHRHNSNQAER